MWRMEWLATQCQGIKLPEQFQKQLWQLGSSNKAITNQVIVTDQWRIKAGLFFRRQPENSTTKNSKNSTIFTKLKNWVGKTKFLGKSQVISKQYKCIFKYSNMKFSFLIALVALIDEHLKGYLLKLKEFFRKLNNFLQKLNKTPSKTQFFGKSGYTGFQKTPKK